MKTKIIIGILALVTVAALIFYFKTPVAPPVTTTTVPPITPTTSPQVTTTTVPAVLAEEQAYYAIDQELSSAIQGISGSDVQSAMTS